MPRQRTKGDRIQIQLPLEIDADVRSHAEARRESPAAFVENVVASSRSEGWVYPIGTQPAETVKLPALKRPTMTVDVSNPDSPICTHPKAKVTVHQTGLVTCGCGATRGVGGEWR